MCENLSLVASQILARVYVVFKLWKARLKSSVVVISDTHLITRSYVRAQRVHDGTAVRCVSARCIRARGQYESPEKGLSTG
jgi:hypothetical protein